LTHRGGVEKETMSFYNELVAIFPDLRVTSGKRTGKEGAGKSAGKSRHVRGQAIDIGKEHADIYYWLMNTEQGLALLDKYNMGVLDETNPKILSKTLSDRQKGSRTEEELLKHAHFHIGMDSTIVPTAKARLKELRETGSITELRAYIDKNPEHKKVVNVLTEEQKVSITLLPESKRKNLLDKIQHGTIINHEQIDTELRKQLANPNPQVDKIKFIPITGQTPKFGQGSMFGQGHLFKKHGGNLFANGGNPDIKINY
jgi:hypothetical protein